MATFLLIIFLSPGIFLLLLPVLFLWSFPRRLRLRSILRSRGWPPMAINPDILIYPMTVYRKIPPYEEVLATSLGDDSPSEQLEKVLQTLSPGSQWMNF